MFLQESLLSKYFQSKNADEVTVRCIGDVSSSCFVSKQSSLLFGRCSHRGRGRAAFVWSFMTQPPVTVTANLKNANKELDIMTFGFLFIGKRGKRRLRSESKIN